MALSTNNAISKIKFGRISTYSYIFYFNTTLKFNLKKRIGLLRLINELFGIKFKIQEHEKHDYDEEIEDDGWR